MKFKYDTFKNSFKMYGEANYVYLYQKEFLKGTNKKIKNLYYEPILLTVILFIFNIILKLLNAPIADAVNVVFVLSIIYIFYLLMGYLNYKSHLKESILKVDKKGITDIGKININFTWESVKLIGITKNMMVIIAEDSYIMFLVTPDEALLKEIQKYKDVKVIRN